jgi:hypothetical protein
MMALLLKFRVIEIVVGVMLGLLAIFWLNSHDATAAAEWKRQLAVAKAEVKTRTIIQRQASVRYDTVHVAWTRYRDRILHDTVTPPTVREREIIAQADKPVAACDTLKVTDTSLIGAQKKEIAVAENPPAKHIQFFGEALYNVIDRLPVARAGVELHVWRSLYIVGAGEWDTAPVGQAGRLRGLVGARVNF